LLDAENRALDAENRVLDAEKHSTETETLLDGANAGKAAVLEQLRAVTGELASLKPLLAAATESEGRLRTDLESERQQSRSREAQLKEDLDDSNEQIAALTKLMAEARDREAKLAAAVEQGRTREPAMEAELRRMRAEFDELADRAGRAERRAGELQSVVDALGRERATVRSEAGALRARLEQMGALEDRLKRVTSELEQVRRENQVLEQELARAKSTRAAPPRALSK